MKTIRAVLALFACIVSNVTATQSETNSSMNSILSRIDSHDFNPGDAMTMDRTLGTPGIADLDNRDWRIRMLAVGDMVRLGEDGIPEIVAALDHENPHVRYLAAMALGILRAESAVHPLSEVLGEDPVITVRSQAAISLGQIGLESSLAALETARGSDPSRDVTHQCELAIHQIISAQPATEELASAWRSLDESTFETIEVGSPAPDFVLTDADGRPWELSAHRGKPVALIWVFADWCPVCHGEFRELIELREEFEEAGIEVVTLEIHDSYRTRVMVGKELEPEYWFADEPFMETYAREVWWRHLSDRAGAVGATYGVDPLAFAVHSEYINRPSTIVVDREGIIRMAYYGTFWGDRPSIHQMLEMMETGYYEFQHPKRLE
ncbi:MAG: hypothetical protein DRP71_09715 [Verrucomicrobia bacterium]|nr:MAG: hypothetical protein DRP71_09715 [Verrucomicrobiota bacterium]